MSRSPYLNQHRKLRSFYNGDTRTAEQKRADEEVAIDRSKTKRERQMARQMKGGNKHVGK